PYILARAGLLAGYRCTVHWEHVPAFVEEFPGIRLSRTIYEIDRDRLTCAGGIAALDMMHAVIAADHGQELAAGVSDWFLRGQVRQG
ncbi:AraC family transcriptional regulator, partial [Acinetobacter baumannii]